MLSFHKWHVCGPFVEMGHLDSLKVTARQVMTFIFFFRSPLLGVGVISTRAPTLPTFILEQYLLKLGPKCMLIIK